MDWRLYFLRHGIASELAEDGSHDDARRALTDVGRRRIHLVVRALRELGEPAQRIYHSPLLRAKQTAEIAAEVLGVGRIEESTLLYPGSDPAELEDLLVTGREPGENVMLVGHQPHLSQALAWSVLSRPHSGLDLKKGGIACVQFSGAVYKAPGTLEWLLVPKLAHFIFPDEEW